MLQKNVAGLADIFFPDHLKTQEMCDKAVVCNPRMIDCIPDKFKTQETHIKAIRSIPIEVCQ